MLVSIIILVLAANAAITVATRSAMKKQGMRPGHGETFFVVVGLLFGLGMLGLAALATAKEIWGSQR